PPLRGLSRNFAPFVIQTSVAPFVIQTSPLAPSPEPISRDAAQPSPSRAFAPFRAIRDPNAPFMIQTSPSPLAPCPEPISRDAAQPSPSRAFAPFRAFPGTRLRVSNVLSRHS